MMKKTFLLMAVIVISGCGGAESNAVNAIRPVNSNVRASVPLYTYDIVKVYPHDPGAFTQGLVFHDGFLYEGTGGRGSDTFHSSLRKVEIETGKVIQKHDLGPQYFGEGIALLGDKIYQLTWREHTAFVYNLADLKPEKEFKYSGDGWGLTTDGTMLFLTDGTHVIRVVDPATFETKRTIVVNDEKGAPLMQLNELEMVNGEIWANIWQSGIIVRIDPANGKLLGRVDFESLVKQEMGDNDKADVLNGIAYDPATDRLFITGKLWKRLFEVKIKPKQ